MASDNFATIHNDDFWRGRGYRRKVFIVTQKCSQGLTLLQGIHGFGTLQKRGRLTIGTGFILNFWFVEEQYGKATCVGGKSALKFTLLRES